MATMNAPRNLTQMDTATKPTQISNDTAVAWLLKGRVGQSAMIRRLWPNSSLGLSAQTKTSEVEVDFG